MKILVAAIFFSCLALPILCLPQREDAEFIPRHFDKGTPAGSESGSFLPNMNDFNALMKRLRDMLQSIEVFGQNSPDTFSMPGIFDLAALLPEGLRPPGSPDVRPRPLPAFPDTGFGRFPAITSFGVFDLGDLPDNYKNTTHDVQVVNGTQIETKSTIVKNRDDNGVFIEQVNIVRYRPVGRPTGVNHDSSFTNDGGSHDQPQFDSKDPGEVYEDFGLKPVDKK